MDPLLILSPHYDDAVLSCGQMIADRPECVVATAFTQIPRRGRMLTTYDKNSGFTSAGRAMQARRFENSEAMLTLGARRGIDLGLLDNQYDPAKDWDQSVHELAERLRDAIEESGATTIVGPVGLAHPDHVVCAGAFRIVASGAPHLDAWLFEDLPSRVLYPIETHERIEIWRTFFPKMMLGFLGCGDRAVKQKAVACYRSQLWALDEPTYLVPERFWRLRPCDD